MKHLMLFAGLAALAACTTAPSQPSVSQSPPEATWREVKPDDLVILETRTGEIVIELASFHAPLHAAQFRAAIRAGAFKNEYFYRVIDGHVAQAGLEFDARLKDWPGLAFEAERRAPKFGFAPHGNADLFTRAPGHRHGFAAGRDGEQEWLMNCTGALAMARDVEAETGSIEFYIPLQPRRYLDRNYTVFGRVISGMQHVHRLNRVEPASEEATPAFFDPKTSAEKFAARAAKLAGNEIVSIKVGADWPEATRPRWQVMDVPSPAWEALKNSKRDYTTIDAFVKDPPKILDVCSLPVPAQRVPTNAIQADLK